MTRLALVDLNPDELLQGLSLYLFVVQSNICNGSFNTIYNLSSKIYIPNKTENINLTVCNIMIEINEIKITLPCNFTNKYKFEGIKCNSKQNLNNVKCQYESKNPKLVTPEILAYALVRLVNFKKLFSNFL